MLSLSLSRRRRARGGKTGGCRGAKQNWVTGASFTLRGHSWDLPTVRFSSFRHIPWLFPKFSGLSLTANCLRNTNELLYCPPFSPTEKIRQLSTASRLNKFPCHLSFLSLPLRPNNSKSLSNYFDVLDNDLREKATRCRSWWTFSEDIKFIRRL